MSVEHNAQVSREVALESVEKDRRLGQTMTVGQVIEKLAKLPFDNEAILLVTDKYGNCEAVANRSNIYAAKDGTIRINLRHLRLVVLP